MCGFIKWMHHAVLLLGASEAQVYSMSDSVYIGLSSYVCQKEITDKQNELMLLPGIG
jgi:hypothetical protein